ncbi:hypothetical protein GV792_03325 [Nocardia cyriacigeorgica]|uniref:hypothetical protein n=1 Tax=Nocardia cyriacigeorgica TaxID=135487 RepID=UPI0013BC44E7|nr:hypothetical protein [Nocardia cyriacigeorgica]NEW37540.1 hypothetical protein [Nocardia cyriacigeorgica]NEW49072.1 hypothetical protein [Nocardia cyriacigeorgica]
MADADTGSTSPDNSAGQVPDDGAERTNSRTDSGGPRTAAGPRPRHRLRWTAVIVLLVVTGVLAMATVLARVAHSAILDTDSYVDTVAPLATDPAVTAALTDRVTEEIVTRIDIEAAVSQALADVAADGERRERVIAGLTPVIADQAEDFVHETVASLIDSDRFADLWSRANRAAHRNIVAVLTGDTRIAAVDIDDSGTISISLAPIIDEAKARLLERGFVFAERIPQVDTQFVLAQSPELAKARRAVDALDRAAGVLPWVTLLAAAAAIALAPTGSRRRATATLGVAVAVAMAVLALAIQFVRSLYLDHLGEAVRSPDAAAAVFDTVAQPLWSTLSIVLVIGVIVAMVAYLVGGSASARTIRRNAARLPGVSKVSKPATEAQP